MTFAIVASKCVHTSSIVGAEGFIRDTFIDVQDGEPGHVRHTKKAPSLRHSHVCTQSTQCTDARVVSSLENSDYFATKVLSSGKSSGSPRHIHWISITLYTLFQSYYLAVMALLICTFSLSLGPAFSEAGNLALGTQTLRFAEGINIIPAMDIAWQT